MKLFSGLIAVVAASLLVVIGSDKAEADRGPWSGFAKLVVEMIKQMKLDEEPSGGDLLDRVLPRDCGRRFTKGDRVAGGYDAKLGEFPSFVRLDIRQTIGLVSLCGGTLISDRHVLTAAHCVPANASVTVVTTIYKDQDADPGDLHKVAKICVSNKYNSPVMFGYDLALIKLNEPVKFNQTIQPACLPKRPSTSWRKLKSVGLGANLNMYQKDSNKIPPAVNFPGRLQVIPVQWHPCLASDRHTSWFCLINSHPNYLGTSCPGDSGGPTYGMENGRQVVVGVTSRAKFGRCAPGLSTDTTSADVYNSRDELANLMKQCQ